MSQKESEWEKEFDRAFASPSWSPAPMKKIFDELMQDGVKPFIRKTIANREKEIAEEVKRILPNRPIDFRTGDTVSDRWEGMEQAIEDVLQILKH